MIGSWLLDLTAIALLKNPDMSDFSVASRTPAKVGGHPSRPSRRVSPPGAHILVVLPVRLPGQRRLRRQDSSRHSARSSADTTRRSPEKPWSFPGSVDDDGRGYPVGSSGIRPSSFGKLAVGAVGIVFGDIGTSVLYAFQQVFAGPHDIGAETSRAYGAVSMIFGR